MVARAATGAGVRDGIGSGGGVAGEVDGTASGDGIGSGGGVGSGDGIAGGGGVASGDGIAGGDRIGSGAGVASGDGTAGGGGVAGGGGSAGGDELAEARARGVTFEALDPLDRLALRRRELVRRFAERGGTNVRVLDPSVEPGASAGSPTRIVLLAETDPVDGSAAVPALEEVARRVLGVHATVVSLTALRLFGSAATSGRSRSHVRSEAFTLGGGPRGEPKPGTRHPRLSAPCTRRRPGGSCP